MTDNLMKQLRGWVDTGAMSDDARLKIFLMRCAADEIERLRAALREISRAGGDLPAEVLLKACIDAARAALAGEKKND